MQPVELMSTVPLDAALLQPGQKFDAFCVANTTRPKWSGPVVPKVGETFASRITYFHHKPKPNEEVPMGTTLKVMGYIIEHTWLFAVCVNINDARARRIYVAGVDLR